MTAAVADAGREMKIDLSAHLIPLQEQVTGPIARRADSCFWRRWARFC